MSNTINKDSNNNNNNNNNDDDDSNVVVRCDMVHEAAALDGS